VAVRRTLAIIAFSFVPTIVFSSVGILSLVFQRAAFDVVFGILTLVFSVAVVTGGIIFSRVMSEQARQAKLQTDFVAKVSHELRTPLASIRMFSDTLQEGKVDDEERTVCLDVISTETSRLTSMIERLLTWGRMESGRRQFDKRPESVDTLVGEALAQLEPQLHAANMRIELELPDESPAVDADRAAIVETLLNLLSNAIKYGAEGGSVTVRVRQRGKLVEIDVEDRGPGIPKREHRRIFERFYRGSEHASGQIPGTGLGLAMAHLVIKAHKGKIRLSSTRGEGACFTVVLPVLSESKAALEVPPG